MNYRAKYGVIFGLIAGLAGVAAHAEPSGAPAVLEPAFPLEPAKKPAQPVKPESYVEGKTEAPGEPDTLIPRLASRPDQWIGTLQLGWFYASQTGDHNFNGVIGAHNAGADILSLGARYDLRGPGNPFSMALQGSVTTGSSDVRPAPAPVGFTETNVSVQNVEASWGLRLHLFPRNWRGDLRLGVDFAGTTTTYLTLTPDLSQFDTDARHLTLLVPVIEYSYSPSSNWALDLGLSYGKALFSTGSGDVTATSFRRVTGKLDFVRYLSVGTAMGLGVAYMNENAVWSQTAPSTLSDAEISQDLDLSLFLRWDY